MNDELTLVPTSRFGALLSAQRREQQIQLARLASESGGSLTVRDLQQIERGRYQLDDDLTLEVAELYGLTGGNILPERKELIVDFDHQFIDTSGRTMNLGGGDTREVLSRYLSLVYMMRNQEPGTELSFRDRDMSTLSSVLEISDKTLEMGLRELIQSHQAEIRQRNESLRDRLVIPGAGILVAALSVGSLVFIGSSAAEDQAVAAGVTDSAIASQAVPSSIGFVANEYSELGLRAETLISYDWKSLLPDWNVTYQQADSEMYAVTDRIQKSVTMYIAADSSPAVVASALAHELGHAIDLSYLNDDIRFQWLEARGMNAVWWPGEGLSDYEVGSGDFAEAVSALWVGSPSYSAQGDFSDTDKELARLIVEQAEASQRAAE